MRIFSKFTAVAMSLCVMLALFAASCDNDPADSSSADAGSTVSSESGTSTEIGETVSDGNSTGISDGSAPAVEFALNTANATLHGKYTEEMGGYSFTYGSAGFSVNFTGTEFWMYVPEVPTEDKDGQTVTREVGVAVLVDSDMAMDATMVNIDRTGWIKLAEGLSEGDHHIEVRKMSRGFFGIMASDWFVASKFGTNEGGVVKTPDPLSDLVVEVYGDSISNGDAVWLDEEGIFGTAGQNHGYTFGNYTGVIERLLDAEVRVAANTGNGLCGWVMAQGGNGEVENLLPPQKSWSVIDPQHGNQPYSHDGANAADVVIINLGTNDRIELGGGDLTDTMFEDEYIRFIKEIKTDCPDAIVICTVGAMGTLKGDNYEVDFSRITGESNTWAGEDFCYYVELQWADSIQGGPGYDGGHPSNIAHEVYGLQLATLINERLDLGVDLPDDIPASAYSGYIDVSDPAKLGTTVDSGVGVYGGDKVAENAFDGNTGTGWQPANTGDMGENCWMGSMFTESVVITDITITWEYGTRPKENTGYRVEYTADGTTWKALEGITYSYEEVKKSAADTDPSYRVDTLTFDKFSAKGIRVVLLANDNTKYAAQILELEIESESNFLPEGNIMEYVTGKSDNLSRVLALLA